MNSIQNSPTIGAGGFGKIRVYYSQHLKEKLLKKW